MKIGDKVILISDRHGCGDTNPVYGQYHDKIYGKIKHISSLDFLKYKIMWNNGYLNSYNKDDLQLYRPKNQYFSDLINYINKELVI